MPDMISQLQLHRLGGLGIPILIEVPDSFACKPREKWSTSSWIRPMNKAKARIVLDGW